MPTMLQLWQTGVFYGLMVSISLTLALAFPTLRPLAGIVFGGVSIIPFAVVAYSRRSASAGSDKGIVLYAQIILGIQVLGTVGFSSCVSAGIIREMPFEGVLLILLILTTSTFYRHVHRIPANYRLAMASVFLAAFLTCEPWSVLGALSERLLVVFA